MRCMVVETQIVIYDRMICMVCFNQMLKGPRALLGCGLDIVNLDGGDVDCQMVPTSSGEELW